MDESDEDFKELCASFFQRVKKNGPKEMPGERKPRKASEGSQIRSRPRRTKQTAAKSKAPPGPAERKTRSGSQAPRAKKQGTIKWQENEPAAPENGEEVPLKSACSTQTGVPSSESQCPPSSCLTTTVTVPSPSKPRAAELVLQRMQQFKRTHPERLKHTCDGGSLEAAPEENAPEEPEEEALNGLGPGLPAMESDAALAWALQQELGQEPAPTPLDGLEEKGLFFCQICQKNLSAMNPTRREQHVNRCLDETEKALTPAVPQVPECPICGRPFLTPKSRLSHLKQCAARMEVGPQLLLQAVRLQTAQPTGPRGEAPASVSSPMGVLKRKAAANKKKEPQKRRRVGGLKAPCEDVLVAMALSRSEMEQESRLAGLGPGSTAERTQPPAEKKGRRKKALTAAPQLLVQDTETTGRQIEDRIAQLFAEEPESLPSHTPPLPASGILQGEQGKARWCLPPPQGNPSFLWSGSALTAPWDTTSFYTASLVPPLVPRKPPKALVQEPALALQPPEPLDRGTRTHPAHPVGCGPGTSSPSSSQRERQALQDLVELAREGLSASQWPNSGSHTSTRGDMGSDEAPGSLPLTGFVLPAEEKHSEEPSQAALALGLLLADFGAMVNNPHLSDVQFQTDSGEVLYAHKFVLYARCPLLMQHVNSDSFLASEDGDPRSQRVLLGDVSGEAARAFLHYLYAADTSPPAHLAPDLSSLARRFGVSELMHLCEQAAAVTNTEGARWEEDVACQGRAENFQELLRSMWAGEDKDAEAMSGPEAHDEYREKVNEAEMDEIYEFAATQRKLLQEDRTLEAEEDRLGEHGPDSGRTLASVPGRELPEDTEQVGPSQPDRSKAAAPQSRVSQAVSPCKDLWAEAPSETPDPARPWRPPRGCRTLRGEGAYLCPVDVDGDDQPFPSAQGHPAPSQTYSDRGEGGHAVPERQGRSSQPPSHPSFSLSQPPPQSGNPRRSQLPSESSPPRPLSQGGASQTPWQDSPSQQRRGRAVLTAPARKGLQYSSTLDSGSRGVLVSPEKSPSIDLTQSRPGPGCCRLSPAARAPSVSKDDEVILLLDSDEELELEQSRAKAAVDQPSEEQEVLEASPTSCELFPIIDVDEEQDGSQSPPGGEATPPQGVEGARDRSSLGSRGTPQLFQDPESSHEDSTTDSSWLVPATPLTSRSRDCSSQTQILGLRPREALAAKLRSGGPPEGRATPDAAKLSLSVPQTPPASPTPPVPGSPDGGKQVPRSPCGPQPRHHLMSSPASCLVPRNLPAPPQKFWGPGPPSQASEVVEVGDSEEEQEAAAPPVRSSPLPDSDPPIPVDDCCWHVEPLSPIPIDHLNLERTGPLSTSSPGGGYSGDPGSPALSTTPIRGSRTSRKRTWERSPRTSSAGSSRPSFLNSALWDDWDSEEPRSPELPALAHTPSKQAPATLGGLETPKGASWKKNLPPKVPITPMPCYSVLETPELKKQLDRYGVRPLPKRQMVLKLKEIFQYTHQTLESDSGDEGQSPKGLPEAEGAAGCTQLGATTASTPQRSKGPRKRQPSRRAPPQSTAPAKEVPPGPNSAQPPASQDCAATSLDVSDGSLSSSQSSSSCEAGVAFESAGDDEEGEEGVSATQMGAMEEALCHYLRSRPALYRRVLQYQPLELAELQAELRQQGLRVAARTLLDFLDAQGITFTTAAARREKEQRAQRRRPTGRKKVGGSSRPVAPSPPTTTSP
ncbi:structure-specific endonuclease subunit SLX4 [Erinaceus europaeus]|uniref:Structure-specific endonuclease subunit SLX4 n=1 Tax=Erinaceus europaeus TaxID=9365 RepID=A0ABM3VVV4_ERIEU|nr:structure-specific endonuclease subunit SLX4 [Erinaceus europaeus]XP_060028457.1 structure-specific endonuclease subunit SLX4 [Erinaceus europaeus]XP_060028458.1 structure-specific endonuclease subunit SLX4 [Erinaceus europaeus]XP_060028459.1 structure-specific endonuclease subunit SLX4 [Erinaceus europaeus]